MWVGVSKSGSPISRWMTLRPFASSARARASTSNADSVPRRDMREAREGLAATTEKLRPPGATGQARPWSELRDEERFVLSGPACVPRGDFELREGLGALQEHVGIGRLHEVDGDEVIE